MDNEAAESQQVAARIAATGGRVESDGLCSLGVVAPMFYLLADRAKLLIVWEALRGVRRFSEFRTRIGLSDGVLSGRLRDLVSFGVLERVRYEEHPPRAEYELTTLGAEFWRVGIAVWEWQRRWGRDVEVLKLVHHGCGPLDSAQFGCAACGRAGISQAALRVERPTSAEIDPAGGDEAAFRYRRAAARSESQAVNWCELDVVIGDRWALNLICHAWLGVTRFSEFERQLAVSPARLSERLSDLVQHGFLRRVPAGGGGNRQHYLLEPKSDDLVPMLLTNGAWVRRWFAARDGPLVTVRHEACGQALQPDWWCGSCHRRLLGGEVHVDR